MRFAIASVVPTIVLAGCASTGSQIDQAKIQTIQPGVTTYNDMVRDFGSPLSTSFNQYGLLQAQWFYFYTGPFGTGQEQQTLTVLFNQDKTVRDVVSTNSAGDGARLGG
ncbi:outer membrane protein assembly factor BamE [Bordetella sp. 15P40C-2]|uniref:outer membrane protein assembly factor BamE domain-containing protein n=1 Tax=Bordetella sp. 15P40C-2 TaxID=2572246 RepID=UPI00132103BB|nr:outer membrane protein assembly factor BamE [Bordetella sp. 15P40C-2]MVW72157.1 outer membrane protein assembly factor BamE [Bordetella sp. 15P40C-2]